jgi:2-dehydro-3-deoxygluconokinase
MVKSPSVVAIGECMLELRAEQDHWQLGHGGDTFNTALYLARLGEEVAYLTALGDDSFSDRMRSDWLAEGLNIDLVLTAPERLPGLYAIQTDYEGERQFHYWRQQAPIRNLFQLPGYVDALDKAANASLLYVSGITLSLFDTAGRAEIAELARSVRDNGGDVAFDPNYRARLWGAPEEARDAISAFAPLVTIALPTFADEVELFGDTEATVTRDRWCAFGAREIVIKLGGDGCMLHDGHIIAPRSRLTPIDTTGAGDAFNAGYLAAHRRGMSGPNAAAFANLLAARVIRCSGAILPHADMPDFETAAAMVSIG